jgi:Ca2+/Na+ antiporter
MSGSYYNPLCARTVIMKFVTWDRRVATSASLAVLCAVLLFVICTFHAASLAAQSSPNQADSPGAQEKQARKLATQTKTITGCLQKGYESDEFSITGEDGKVWGLRSSAVKLDGHLGQKVTVNGLITHESKAGETKKGKTERAPGNEESGNLRVASLKMVSKTCGK